MIRAFLSGLAWGKGKSMRETLGTTCSAGPLAIGKGPSGGIIDNGPIEYVPDPANDRTKLALALYREALSVNMVAYQFLGYFKIINVIHESGPDQIAWINATAENVTSSCCLGRRCNAAGREDDCSCERPAVNGGRQRPVSAASSFIVPFVAA